MSIHISIHTAREQRTTPAMASNIVHVPDFLRTRFNDQIERLRSSWAITRFTIMQKSSRCTVRTEPHRSGFRLPFRPAIQIGTIGPSFSPLSGQRDPIPFPPTTWTLTGSLSLPPITSAISVCPRRIIFAASPIMSTLDCQCGRPGATDRMCLNAGIIWRSLLTKAEDSCQVRISSWISALFQNFD
jgi:hypothetical protein